MNIKNIARIVAGLALAIGVAAATGLGPGAPLAHAAAGPGPCTVVSCYQAPSLMLTGGNGAILISGAHWAPNHEIEIDVWGQFNGNWPIEWILWAYTDSSGSFLTTYLAPAACYNNYMSVDAWDSLTKTYLRDEAVPGC